jgi:hypothetical protein
MADPGNLPWWNQHLDPMDPGGTAVGGAASPEQDEEEERLKTAEEAAEPTFISEGPPSVTGKAQTGTPHAIAPATRQSPGEELERAHFHHSVDMATPADQPPEEAKSPIPAYYRPSRYPSLSAFQGIVQQVLQQILHPEAQQGQLLSPADLASLSHLWLANGGV